MDNDSLQSPYTAGDDKDVDAGGGSSDRRPAATPHDTFHGAQLPHEGHACSDATRGAAPHRVHPYVVRLLGRREARSLVVGGGEEKQALRERLGGGRAHTARRTVGARAAAISAISWLKTVAAAGNVVIRASSLRCAAAAGCHVMPSPAGRAALPLQQVPTACSTAVSA